MITAGTIGFVSCQKQQKEEVRGKNKHHALQRNYNDTLGYVRIKGAFRWDGKFGAGQSENCKGGDCGQCPGICLIITFSLSRQPLTPQEILQGYGTALAKVENDTLYFIPERTIDNGDGNVRIASHFDIGNEVAHALGKNNVVISKGVYSLNYNFNQPYGLVKFPVICQ